MQQAGAISAGKLHIEVHRRDGVLRHHLIPPSPLPVETWLQGRSTTEAARLVPMVFNICAAAQGLAVRSALGLNVEQELEDGVRAESLREHAVKLCLVWPPLLGEAASRDALAHAGRALNDSLAGNALRKAVFAPMAQAPATLSELRDWAETGETAPARAFARLFSDWDPAWGRADLPMFDSEQAVDWPEATQGGSVVENAPGSRVSVHLLLKEIADQFGHGMLYRMATRLVELDQLLDGTAAAPLTGRGVAQAARGAMLVQATTKDNRIERFCASLTNRFCTSFGRRSGDSAGDIAHSRRCAASVDCANGDRDHRSLYRDRTGRSRCMRCHCAKVSCRSSRIRRKRSNSARSAKYVWKSGALPALRSKPCASVLML